MINTSDTSGAWLRAAADASLDALFVAKGVRDKSGNLVDFECIDINSSATALLGMERGKAIGQKLWGLLPINRADFFDKYAQVVETGTALEEDFPFDDLEKKAKWLRHQVVRVGDGIAIFARDVTLWRMSEAHLRENEERLRLATAAAQMGAWTWDLKNNRFSLSEGTGPVFGLPPGEGFHTPEELVEAAHPADRDRLAHALAEGREKGTPFRVEFRTIWPDGTLHWVECRSDSIRGAQGVPERGAGIAMDITERKQAEEALARESNRNQVFLRNASDGLHILDADGNVLEVSDSFCRMLGYSREELIGANVSLWDAQWPPQELKQKITEQLAKEGPSVFETQHRRRDGSLLDVEVTSNSLKLDGKPVLFNSARDITVRKLVQEALRENEARLNLALQSASMGVWHWDIAENKRYFDAQACSLGGIDPATFTGTADEFFRVVHPDDREALKAALARTVEQDVLYRPEYRVIWPDGSIRYLAARGRLVRDDKGQPVRVNGVIWDITERKAGELALFRSNRALRTLSACNAALVDAVSEPELLDTVCRLIVDAGGYTMAWVGFTEQSPEKLMRVVAQYGTTKEYLESMHKTWTDTEQGRGPTGVAIRTGTTQVHQSLMDDADKAPWRVAALAQGYQSSIALPLKGASDIIGALTLYGRERDAFTKDEVRLLEELADDLAFGITTLRTRGERDRMTDEYLHHAEILRKSLEESIQAIADTVEMRDPYTAGHQQRVAKLAAAIASDMGISKDEIHGIQLAAEIHDLGKIRVPAEILSKPGKLTDIEFMLIKAHAQAGYDILKGIAFPWPIAKIVLQHHERLDGSGYPQGLKGDEILLGSRILAVADVAEAMASHRPYRPSMGIDAALAEIESGRGTIFDPMVVDACLKLFREGWFAFQE